MSRDWNEQQRKVVSDRNKRLGLTPPSRKGIKCSQETRLRMSKAKKGWVVPIETRIKRSISQQGNKSNLWQGGLSSLQQLIRTSFKYRQWRSDVFTRDDFTCQFCKQRGKNLQADHIKPLSIILKESDIKTFDDALMCEEIWNINNGRTLCIDCHKETDSYMEKAKKWQSKL